MTVNLRDYQQTAHEEIIQAFRQNKRPLVVARPGAGKSILSGGFVDRFKDHFKFVFIVRTRDLVEQLGKDALGTFGIDYSVFMAGHEKMDLNKNIQVCSKDTMDARNHLPFLGEANVIVIVDEADEFKDFQKEVFRKYREHSNRVFFFGMTATPYNGLNQYDVVIEPITGKELLERGILVPFKYYVPKRQDFSDVEIKNGKFSTRDLLKKMDTKDAIAEGFEAWLRFGDNRQTLVFAVNKSHGKRIAQYINDYYQKEMAIFCEAGTPKPQREAAKEKFKRGEIRFLVNIRLFTRGTNIVEIGAIWDQASTLSLNLHHQKLGRGSRKNPFYSDCLVIDFANNCVNLGGFYQEIPINLKSEYKKTKEDLEQIAMRVCENCFRAATPKEFGPKNICPFCGEKNKPEKKKKLSKYMQKKTQMENMSEEQLEQIKMINDYKKILWKKKNLGTKYPYNIAQEKAQEELIKKYGLDKVFKVKKSIGLKEHVIERVKRRQSYKPLGGIL